MRLQTFNEDALFKATMFLVGPQATAAIHELYTLIDAAQKEAYDQGVLQGQENVEKARADAWDYGYDTGEADGMTMADDAYIQGVADARARPEAADEKVAMLAEKRLLDAVEEDADEDEFCEMCQSYDCQYPNEAI